jgi:hypothetical protein
LNFYLYYFAGDCSIIFVIIYANSVVSFFASDCSNLVLQVRNGLLRS